MSTIKELILSKLPENYKLNVYDDSNNITLIVTPIKFFDKTTIDYEINELNQIYKKFIIDKAPHIVLKLITGNANVEVEDNRFIEIVFNNDFTESISKKGGSFKNPLSVVNMDIPNNKDEELKKNGFRVVLRENHI